MLLISLYKFPISNLLINFQAISIVQVTTNFESRSTFYRKVVETYFDLTDQCFLIHLIAAHFLASMQFSLPALP